MRFSNSIGLIAIALWGISAPAPADEGDASRPGEGLRQSVVTRTKLAEFPGKEAFVFVGEFQPLARTGRHRHPGTEFLYVLEGHGVLERDGHEPVELKPGVGVFSEPDPGKKWFTHQARNLSKTDVMKTFVVLIHDEGGPPGIPLED